MRAIDRDLGVASGDHRLGTQRPDATIGIGEIALRPIGGPAVRSAFRFAGLHHAQEGSRSVIIGGWRLLGFVLERRFGGADTLEARHLVGDPIGHLDRGKEITLEC